MKIEEAKSKYERQLLGKPNVVGVMTGHKVRGSERMNELSIVCLVEKKLAAETLKKKELVPSTIRDFPTDVIQVGVRRDDRRDAPHTGGIKGSFDPAAGGATVDQDRIQSLHRILPDGDPFYTQPGILLTGQLKTQRFGGDGVDAKLIQIFDCLSHASLF